MKMVLGVRFKKAGKIYSFSPGDLEIQKGDHVIVETARGLEYGEVVIGPREEEAPQPLKVVQRKATAADTERVRHNKEHAKDAFAICEQKIAEHGLPMKLVDVEYTFDMNKVVFYFTADGRVDFRELVKDLASVFRTRIELRQIGVRDEAKLMGGIGCCGRPLCCATFLGDFAPVSIRMAKEQNLSLNPAKISGICGRLMCCLKYESNCYCGGCPKKQKTKEPEQGSTVVLEQGEGKVISTNAQRHTATVLLTTGRTVIAPWGEMATKEENEQAAFIPRENGEAHEEEAGDSVGAGTHGEARPPRVRRPRAESGEPRERHGEGRRHAHEERRGRDFSKSRSGHLSHGRGNAHHGERDEEREKSRGRRNARRRDRQPRPREDSQRAPQSHREDET